MNNKSWRGSDSHPKKMQSTESRILYLLFRKDDCPKAIKTEENWILLEGFH